MGFVVAFVCFFKITKLCQQVYAQARQTLSLEEESEFQGLWAALADSYFPCYYCSMSSLTGVVVWRMHSRTTAFQLLEYPFWQFI